MAACSNIDIACHLQAFVVNYWITIVLGLVALIMVVFAPWKFKLLGAAVLLLMYTFYFGLVWIGVPPHFGMWLP